MSFLKIKDPSKDALVAEYLKTKNKIQNDFRSERLGEQSPYKDFGKILKPITEQQKKSSEEIVSKFTPLQEAIENMPPALPWGQVEGQLEALPEPELDTPQIELDETSLAGEYLQKYSERKGDADKAFGIIREKGKYFMVGKRVIIHRDSNLFVGGKRYQGTSGLWKLIALKGPNIDEISHEDKDKYLDLLYTTNAKFSTNKYGVEKIAAARSKKHKIIQLEGEKKGKGVILPSDPNALCERLELLMASKQAGNTGLRNEIVSICDELLRQKILSHDAYKNLMLTLNK